MAERRVLAIVLLVGIVSTGAAIAWPDRALPLVAAATDADEAAMAATRAQPAAARVAPAPGLRTAPPESHAADDAPRRPPTAEQRSQFGPLIADLANDDIPGNAGDALHQLARAKDATALLFEALDSRDLQQRQLAARALTLTDRPSTSRLAEILVEGMAERVEDELRRTLIGGIAGHAARFLYRHPEHARPALRRALWTGDEQQRFLAAFLLGCDGSVEDLPMIVRILANRLADNHIEGDAMMAAHALFRLGPPIIPVLRSRLRFADEQERQLTRLILLDLESPPLTEQDFLARRAMHNVTWKYHDPIIEFAQLRTRFAAR